MRKATVVRMFVKEIYGQASNIVNARQEIARGKGNYGISRFQEIDNAEEFKEMILEDNKVYAVETLSGKIVEVGKTDLGKFTNL